MKNKQDPVAGEDGDYPSWLWGVLAEAKERSGKEDLEGDLFGMRHPLPCSVCGEDVMLTSG